MRLSYSSISSYLKCPLSYKLQYVDRLPTEKKPELSFGSSLHAALAHFYKAKTPHPMSLEELLDYLPKVWESAGYLDKITEENHKDHARRILTQFYRANVDSFNLPIALEHKFGFDLDGLTVTGIIDRVDKLAGGGFEVIDYKTSRRLPPKSALENDLQLSIYHLAAQKIWGIEPEALTLYFLLPNQRMSTTRDETQIEATKSQIMEVAEGIESGVFPARENPLCGWCDFMAYCPHRSHRFAKSKEALDIRKVVDEYLELDARIKEFKQRLEQLQPLIHDYCEKEGQTRLFGQTGAVCRSARKALQYDEDKVRALLEPFGLWDEVATLNNARLKEILAKEKLPVEVRKLIEAAVEIEKTTYALYVQEATQAELPIL